MKKITQNLTNVKAWQSIVFAFMFLFSLTINAQEVGQEYLANPSINTATGANSTTPDTGWDGPEGNANFNFQSNGNYGGWTGGLGGAYASATDANGDCHSADRMFKFNKVGGADGQYIFQTINSLPAGNYNWSLWTKWGDAGHANGPTGAAAGNLPTWSAEGDNEPKFTILFQDAEGNWVADQVNVTTEPTAALTWVQDAGTWTNTETRDVRVKIAKNGGTNTGGSNTDKLMYIDDVSLAYASALETTSGCELTVNMVDTFGDGWNGNVLDIYVNDVLVSAGNTIESGSTGTATISTNYGDSVLFDMVASGSYIGETEFTVTDASGEVVASAADGADATFECLDPDAINFAVSVDTDGANATFSLTLANFTVGAAAGEGDGHIHWSIFDSSDLATEIASGMIYSTEDVTLPLPNGNHTMVFSLVDPNHLPFDPPFESTVVFSTFDGIVDCESSYTYTYGDNESGILFTSTNPNGEAVTVTMTGQTETCCDEVVITDGAGNELYNLGGDHTGVSVTSEDGTINVSIVSDSSWSPGGNGLGNGTEMTFDITCAAAEEEAALEFKGILDFTVNHGAGFGANDGKAVHLLATGDIADLSTYSIALYANGSTDVYNDFTLPAISASSGDEILIARSPEALEAYMSASTLYTTIIDAGNWPTSNGNDAMELVRGYDTETEIYTELVDTFGIVGDNPDTSGSGCETDDCWDHEDAWAYKADGVWTYGPVNSTDGDSGSASTNMVTICDSEFPYPFVICSSDPVFHDITFTVDARNILVRDRGMYVGGGIFGSADAHAMSDEDGDGVWSVVISLEEGATYTAGNPAGNWGFFNSPMDGGDWNTKENLDGLECADTENYNDRILPAINADTAEIAYCFASCDTGCDTLVTRHDVTFNVDTNNIEVGTEGMWLGGGIMGSGKAHQLFDEDGDGVYTRVLSMIEGTTGNWVFLNSPPNHYEYGGKEDLAGQDCAVGEYNDRLLDPVTGAAEYTFCFASCDVSCSSGPVAIVAPWSDDFEDGDVSDWTQFQAGDESTGWTLLEDGQMYHADDDVATGVDNYFISPLLDCTGLTEPLLTYTEYQTYNVSWYDYHSVSYSEDYNGENAATATWTELTNGPAPYDLENAATLEFAIPNTATAVAFRYSGDYADNWIIDNVSVTETPAEPNAVDSNPDQAWTGYMNVFDIDADGVQGGFVFGQGWGVADLQTTLNVDAPNIILEPNFNAYNADDAFWSNGEGEGNKFMEASTYVESGDAFNGADLTFTGSVYENTLGDAHTASYFIKSLDPNAGYSDSLGGAYVFEMPASGEFSVTVDAALLPAGQIVQYGFVVTGRNANPENTGYGRVVIGEAGLSVSNNTPLDMVIYPNPSNGSYVTIQTPVNGVKYVEVFDITGKRLINTSLSADTLDVSSISSGLYLVKVTVEGQSKTSKLIIR